MVPPESDYHDDFVSELGFLLKPFAKNLKAVCVQYGSPGFIVERNPDTLVAPDLAVYAQLPRSGTLEATWP